MSAAALKGSTMSEVTIDDRTLYQAVTASTPFFMRHVWRLATSGSRERRILIQTLRRTLKVALADLRQPRLSVASQRKGAPHHDTRVRPGH